MSGIIIKRRSFLAGMLAAAAAPAFIKAGVLMPSKAIVAPPVEPVMVYQGLWLAGGGHSDTEYAQAYILDYDVDADRLIARALPRKGLMTESSWMKGAKRGEWLVAKGPLS